MAHIHNIYDTDPHFQINEVTRMVKDVSTTKTTIVQYDHNSERITFELPRIIDGHDMSTCNIVQVHYLNVDGKDKTIQHEGVYEVDDLQISPDSDDVVIFSWLVSGNATQLVGTINFVCRFICTSDDTTVDYAWNTATYAGIIVSAGLYFGDTVVQEYYDVLAQWETKMEAMFNEGIAAVETAAAQAAQNVLQEAKESGEFDGADGVSVTHEWEGTTLKIKSASGESSADLKGEQGEQGEPGSVTGDIKTILFMNQDEYEALENPSDTTLYLIRG